MSSENSRDYLDVFNKVTKRTEKLLRCNQCGLVYVNENLRTNRSFYYNEKSEMEESWKEQFPDAMDVYESGAWGVKYHDVEDVTNWQCRSVSDFLGERLNVPGYTVAEIGAARGYLLSKIAKQHPKTRLIGIEPSPIMAQIAKKSGAEIINGVIENTSFQSNSIDAVIGFGSFIQIRDPLTSLKHINSAIKMGGRILLDSPNNDSLFRWLIRFLCCHRYIEKISISSSTIELVKGKVYHPGRFYYYTSNTYSELLNLAGFEIIDVRYRQPRYIIYGRANIPAAMKLAARVLSIAERLFGKESWVEVRGVKRR